MQQGVVQLPFLPAAFNSQALPAVSLSVWGDWIEFKTEQLLFMRDMFRQSIFMQTAFARITDVMFRCGVRINESTPIFDGDREKRYHDWISSTWPTDFVADALRDFWLIGFTHAIYIPHSEYGMKPVPIDMTAVRMEYRTTPSREFEWRISPKFMGAFSTNYLDRYTDGKGHWNVPSDFAYAAPPRVYTWYHRKPLGNGLVDSIAVAAMMLYRNKMFDRAWYELAHKLAIAPTVGVSHDRPSETKIALHATDMTQAMLPRCTAASSDQRTWTDEEKKSLNAGTLHVYMRNRGMKGVVETNTPTAETQQVNFHQLGDYEKLEHPIPIGPPPDMSDIEVREAEQLCALFGMPWNRMSTSSTKKTLIQSQPKGEDSSDQIAYGAVRTWSALVERMLADIYYAGNALQMAHRAVQSVANEIYDEDKRKEDEKEASNPAVAAAATTIKRASAPDHPEKVDPDSLNRGIDLQQLAESHTPEKHNSSAPYFPGNDTTETPDVTKQKKQKEHDERMGRARTKASELLRVDTKRAEELKSKMYAKFVLPGKVDPMAIETLYTKGKMTDAVYDDWYARMHHIPIEDILEESKETSVDKRMAEGEEKKVEHGAEAKEKAKAKYNPKPISKTTNASTVGTPDDWLGLSKRKPDKPLYNVRRLMGSKRQKTDPEPEVECRHDNGRIISSSRSNPEDRAVWFCPDCAASHLMDDEGGYIDAPEDADTDEPEVPEGSENVISDGDTDAGEAQVLAATGSFWR